MLDPVTRQEILDNLPDHLYIGNITRLKKQGNLWKGLCPFHKETRPSFFVYPDGRGWYCFGSCQEGGDLFNFVMKHKRVSFPEAVEILARAAGVDLPTSVNAQRQAHLLRLMDKAAEVYHQGLLQGQSPLARRCRRYLAERGISEESIKIFRLGFAPANNQFSQLMLAEGCNPNDLAELNLINQQGRDFFFRRLMFPICDYLGRTRGFAGRSLDEDHNAGKYINSPKSPIFDKSRLLYGLHLAGPFLRKQFPLVVEGYTDVITAHQAGYSQTIGLMGVSLTPQHLERIKRYNDTAVLIYDGDEAGFKALSKQAKIYDRGLKLEALILPQEQDPDSLIRSDLTMWEACLHQEIAPLLEVYILQMAARLNLNGADSRRSFVKEIAPALLGLDAVRRDYYVGFVAGQLGVRPDSIQLTLKKAVTAFNPPMLANQSGKTRQDQDLEDVVLSAIIVNPFLAEMASVNDFHKEVNRLIFQAVLSDELDDALETYFNYLIELWDAQRLAKPTEIRTEVGEILARLRDQTRQEKIEAEINLMTE